MIVQISRLGRASMIVDGRPAIALVTTPRMRSATGASAAALSGASMTLWTVNSRSSVSSTNGRCGPVTAISTDMFPPSLRCPSAFSGRLGCGPEARNIRQYLGLKSAGVVGVRCLPLRS